MTPVKEAGAGARRYRMLLALGANLPRAETGARDTLSMALERLEDQYPIRIVARSCWYRTPAFPPGSGPDFVNGAAEIETRLGPGEVLAALHAVEADLGRARPARWAPRVCDLDLIAAGQAVLPDADTQARWMGDPAARAGGPPPPVLVLPHPRMQERAFVLVPLAEIAPGWRHPVLGLTVAELRDRLDPAARAEVVPLRDGGAGEGG